MSKNEPRAGVGEKPGVYFSSFYRGKTATVEARFIPLKGIHPLVKKQKKKRGLVDEYRLRAKIIITKASLYLDNNLQRHHLMLQLYKETNRVQLIVLKSIFL